MRYRIKDYKITAFAQSGRVGIHFNIPSSVNPYDDEETLRPLYEAVRLVVDETAKEVFCSSMQKDRILVIDLSSQTGYTYRMLFDIPTGKTITTEDQFTIEFDFGEAPEDMKDPNSQLVADFFNITEATDYEAASDSEILNELDDLWTEITGKPVPSSGGSSSN